MITVYTFGPAWEMPDPSPFVLKVLVFLELAGIPYKAVLLGSAISEVRRREN